MWLGAQDSARKRNLPFKLKISDINIPARCPLLGIRLFHGTQRRTENSPSLDRFDNSKGYTPENVWVISRRANRIKNDATFAEFEKLYKHWRRALFS